LKKVKKFLINKKYYFSCSTHEQPKNTTLHSYVVQVGHIFSQLYNPFSQLYTLIYPGTQFNELR